MESSLFSACTMHPTTWGIGEASSGYIGDLEAEGRVENSEYLRFNVGRYMPKMTNATTQVARKTAERIQAIALAFPHIAHVLSMKITEENIVKIV